MRYWVINNKFLTSWYVTGGMFSLLMIMVTPVIADSAADGDGARYKMQQVADSSNPWALPQQQAREPETQQPPYYYEQRSKMAADERQKRAPRYDDELAPPGRGHQWQPQSDKFVSPEFLESLKKQQQQYQVMPENYRHKQPAPGYYVPGQPRSGLPGQGQYGYPSYGMGAANPLYDAPAVSPWGDGPDVLYRGESFPLVPSEALGGFSPMHVPSIGVGEHKDNGFEESRETGEYKVFNPFTFLPNGSSR